MTPFLLLLLSCLWMSAPTADAWLQHTALQRVTRKAVSAGVLALNLLTNNVDVAAAVDGVSPTGLYKNAQGFYDAWNARDVEKAMTYFSDGVIFYDAQYSRPFIGKEKVREYIQECADSLPGWAFIIDDYSEDVVRRKVGLKWHVSDSSNVPLPFPNRGVSFLAFDADGLIKVRSMGLA